MAEPTRPEWAQGLHKRFVPHGECSDLLVATFKHARVAIMKTSGPIGDLYAVYVGTQRDSVAVGVSNNSTKAARVAGYVLSACFEGEFTTDEDTNA